MRPIEARPHEVYASAARLVGDGNTCEAELNTARRLWTEMGAPLQVERLKKQLVD